MERTITLEQIKFMYDEGVKTFSVKDNSPRGIKDVSAKQIKLGDEVVIDNYFYTVTAEPSKTISALLVEPMKHPRIISIDRGLKALQNAVGGYIEQLCPFYDEVSLVVNEEGKLNCLPLNRAVYYEDTGEMFDVIAGTFLVMYAPWWSEDYESLPNELADKYKAMFEKPETFCRLGGRIVATKIED